MNKLLHDGVLHLRSGGLLLYPTETAYAVGCDATNPIAVRRVFALKERAGRKPLPLIVASTAQAWEYARPTPLARRLAQRYWPGPLTLVLRQRRRFPHGVAATDGSIAIRVSPHVIARSLARRLGRPIVATSANRSGMPTCYSIRSALRSLGARACAFPLRVIDVGVLPRRRPSTVVDARRRHPIVLRIGAISHIRIRLP